jgi:hypothetical protein
MDQVIYGEKPLKVDRVRAMTWFMLALPIAVGAAVFLAVAVLGNTGHAPGIVELVVVVVATIFVLGAGWLAIKQRSTIWPDRIDYENGLGTTRSLLRSGIKGFRHSSKNEKIILIPRDEFAKPITVSAGLLTGAQTKSWFEGIPDLDAQDFEAAQKILESDTRLGATDVERRGKLARITLTTRIVNGAGFLFGFWSLFTSWPYEVPVFGVIVTMLAVLAVKFYFGAFVGVSSGTGRVDPRPTMWPTVWICCFGLGARSLSDNHILDWVMALEWAGVIALGISFFLIMQDERMRTNILPTLFFVLVLVGFSYGVIVTANRVFDHAPPSVFHTWIDEKHVNNGKSTSYEVTLDAWSDQPAGMSIQVPYAFYHSVQLSDVVCVVLSKGALGLRHFRVGHCSVGVDRRSEIMPASRPS